MRAQVLATPGGADQLHMADVPAPALKPGHVLIRVAASAVNPVDIKIRGGLPIGPDLPAILGCDVAGTIEAVGAGVEGLAPGDAVYGCAGGVKGQGGSLAELMLADARLIAPKPASLSMRAAAALPLVSITAWDGLDRAGVRAGDHVLVHGGTGGVGHVAVQLAKARGARVAATVSSAEAARTVCELGADDAINRQQEQPAAYVQRLTGGRGFDVVVDTVGGPNLDLSFGAAAPNGRVVATAARSTHDLSPLHGKGLSLHVVFMLLPMLRDEGREKHGRILRELATLVEAGKVRPLLDPHRFDLAHAAEAHRHLESGKAVGKVVVEIA